MSIDIQEFIKKNTSTPIAKKFYNMLKEIWDEENFLISMLLDLKTDEKKQKMIDLLEETSLTDTDEIIVHCMAIRDNTDVATIKERYGFNW
ncbi:TPA: hypothetical protein IAA87_07980 [Candidatus Avigastranaerophilus faecigallinarum]|nr:hypothetical protein [Candidatus Avigastranaerophilus faecigallinarum]